MALSSILSRAVVAVLLVSCFSVSVRADDPIPDNVINPPKCVELGKCMFQCKGYFVGCIGLKAVNQSSNTNASAEPEPFWGYINCYRFIKCVYNCKPMLDACISSTVIPVPFDQNDRVDFKLTTSAANLTFKIQNANLQTGKFYEHHPQEVGASTINSKTFSKGQSISFGACGRESALLGTEGSFDVFPGDEHYDAVRYTFKVPYGVTSPGVPEIRQTKNPNSKYNCELIRQTFNNYSIDCFKKA